MESVLGLNPTSYLATEFYSKLSLNNPFKSKKNKKIPTDDSLLDQNIPFPSSGAAETKRKSKRKSKSKSKAKSTAKVKVKSSIQPTSPMETIVEEEEELIDKLK
jgi:hypothetical protein